MTTTMAKPDSTTERPLSHRIPTVAANLLPAEVIEARRTRQVRRLAIVLVALVVLGMIGWYGFARVQTGLAEDELADARAETVRLDKQQEAFAELRQVRGDSDAIKRQLEQLMANDVTWPTLLTNLRQAAPSGLVITGVTVNLDASRTTGSSAGNAGNAPVAFATITGLGTSKPQVAQYVDALSKVNGVADPFISSVTAGERGLDFNVQINITTALLGGRYAKAAK
jgi:Tfp pilus assembly protein PilN